MSTCMLEYIVCSLILRWSPYFISYVATSLKEINNVITFKQSTLMSQKSSKDHVATVSTDARDHKDGTGQYIYIRTGIDRPSLCSCIEC